jgi:hypothetical protein
MLGPQRSTVRPIIVTVWSRRVGAFATSTRPAAQSNKFRAAVVVARSAFPQARASVPSTADIPPPTIDHRERLWDRRSEIATAPFAIFPPKNWKRPPADVPPSRRAPSGMGWRPRPACRSLSPVGAERAATKRPSHRNPSHARLQRSLVRKAACTGARRNEKSHPEGWPFLMRRR